jgi:predicted nucleic acid-binding protein
VIVFLDASALVKRYVEEPGSEIVRRVLGTGVPVVSRLTEVEITSALARRCREGHVDLAARDAALADLARDLEAIFVVELGPEVVSKAAGLLKRRPLRAADAVQLASCLVLADRLVQPVQLLAFDQRLVEAATAEGAPTVGVTDTSGAWPAK